MLCDIMIIFYLSRNIFFQHFRVEAMELYRLDLFITITATRSLQIPSLEDI